MASLSSDGMTTALSGGPATSVPQPVVSIRTSTSFGEGGAAGNLNRCIHGGGRYAGFGNETCHKTYLVFGHRGAQASQYQHSKCGCLGSMSSQSGCELVLKFFQMCDSTERGRFILRSRKCGANSRICCGQSVKARVRHQVTGNAFHQGNAERILWTSAQSEKKRIFIFGIGFTSSTLAGYLLKNNWIVSGTCRSIARKAALEQLGYRVQILDSDSEGEKLRDGLLRELQQANYWLVSVPPVVSDNKDPILSSHLRDLEGAVKYGNVGWIGYLSSTGVYGDWQGKWVDEESEPRPVEPRAVARLAAEEAWLKFGSENGVPIHIFRLGGIYGLGRSALDAISRNAILSERQRRREQQRYTSRIHVADISRAIFASMQNPRPVRIYNVVDDDPAPRAVVLDYAQTLLDGRDSNSGRHVATKSSSGGASGTTQNAANSASQIGEKRVSNRRLKEELQVELLYPSYKSGLEAIFEAAADFSS